MKHEYKRAIDNLRKFSHIATFKNIISEWNHLHSQCSLLEEHFVEKFRSDIIESLRNQLNDVLLDEDKTTKAGPSNLILPSFNPDKNLSKAVHNVMLVLAKMKPINKEDPITQEIIPEFSAVFVSTGHQFDLAMLIQYHNTRYYRGKTLKETDKSKWLINPITNLKFHPLDVAHICAVARGNGIIIQDLKLDALPEGLEKIRMVSAKDSQSFFHLSLNSDGLNYIQEKLLNDFQQYGLMAEHLRDKNWLTLAHSSAIKYLFEQKHLNAQQVLQELDGLDGTLALRIAKGLSKTEILSLNSNYLLLDLFLQCKQYGLTTEHLQGKQWLCPAYTPALEYLFLQRHLTPVQALEEIDGLSMTQSWGIRDGLNRTEVQILGNNFFLYHILVECKQYGLRAEDLQNKNWLTFGHIAPLKFLFTQCQLSPSQAMQEIDGLSETQVEKIIQGETREQILSDSNQYNIKM